MTIRKIPLLGRMRFEAGIWIFTASERLLKNSALGIEFKWHEVCVCSDVLKQLR